MCLVPLDDIYLGAQVARIKLKGGGIEKSWTDRGEFKSALDTRLKGLLKTRDKKKKEIIKKFRNIFLNILRSCEVSKTFKEKLRL